MSFAFYFSRVLPSDSSGGITWKDLSNCPGYREGDQYQKHCDFMGARGIAPLLGILVRTEERCDQREKNPEQQWVDAAISKPPTPPFVS
jgi:hypothetical protein